MLQLKEMIQREVQRSTTENARNSIIISDYKQICSQLSQRLEEQVAAAKATETELKVNEKQSVYLILTLHNFTTLPKNDIYC
jgi:hypothetical protein